MEVFTEDARSTRVQILLRDSDQIVKTNYQLQLLDTLRGKVRFIYNYRNDSSGKSTSQSIREGIYNIRLSENYRSTFIYVPILKNKKNIIVGYLSKGYLFFKYDSQADRPITEFNAKVHSLSKPTLITAQRCTEELKYPAGRYLIEINSLPTTILIVDIDWNSGTLISLSPPGYVEIINNTALGLISFYKKQEMKLSKFYEIDAGQAGPRQKVQLQPGHYEVHWASKNNKGRNNNNINQFSVKSNSLTEVKLGR